jgi:hypothetical protein
VLTLTVPGFKLPQISKSFVLLSICTIFILLNCRIYDQKCYNLLRTCTSSCTCCLVTLDFPARLDVVPYHVFTFPICSGRDPTPRALSGSDDWGLREHPKRLLTPHRGALVSWLACGEVLGGIGGAVWAVIGSACSVRA